MKFFSMVKRSALAAAICGTFLWGGVASAEQTETGMEAFKEALTMNASQDHRVFREQVIFFLPDLKADLDFQAVSHKVTDLRVQGNLTSVSTNDKGNTVTYSIPFYLDQSKKKMALYFQTDEGWRKCQAPTASAAAVDVLGAPDSAELTWMLSLAKSAEVVRETDAQRTMVIDLDETALAAMVDQFCAEGKDEAMTESERALQERFVKYLKQGIQHTDVWCTWTVDKRDWQTITFAINLSGVIQESAKAALEDPDADLGAPFQSLLESLAYYSELRAYTTYLDPDTKTMIDIPKEVKQAKDAGAVLPGGK